MPTPAASRATPGFRVIDGLVVCRVVVTGVSFCDWTERCRATPAVPLGSAFGTGWVARQRAVTRRHTGDTAAVPQRYRSPRRSRCEDQLRTKETAMFYLAIVPVPGVAASPDRKRAIERFFDAIQRGDALVLGDVLTPDAITRWPQSGERITGAQACIRV